MKKSIIFSFVQEYLKISILVIILLTFLLSSCGNSDDETQNELRFKNSLVEQSVGKSNYYISLPQDYSLLPDIGVDFAVFYISPADTTKRVNFSGGIYFGNNPDEFKVKKNECKVEKLEATILGKKSEWTIYNCKSNYIMQMLIKNNNSSSMGIHLWAYANNRTELNKMITIFSTLKQK